MKKIKILRTFFEKKSVSSLCRPLEGCGQNRTGSARDEPNKRQKQNYKLSVAKPYAKRVNK